MFKDLSPVTVFWKLELQFYKGTLSSVTLATFTKLVLRIKAKGCVYVDLKCKRRQGMVVDTE